MSRRRNPDEELTSEGDIDLLGEDLPGTEELTPEELETLPSEDLDGLDIVEDDGDGIDDLLDIQEEILAETKGLRGDIRELIDGLKASLSGEEGEE